MVPAETALEREAMPAARTAQSATAQSASEPAGPSAAQWTRPIYDSWELGEELREVGRRYLGENLPGGCRPAPGRPNAQAGGEQTRAGQTDQSGRAGVDPAVPARLDQPHAAARLPHFRGPRPGRAARRTRQKNSLAGLAWLALSLGTSAFVCGGILLGWSLLADRPELWSVGLPVTLCGQVALLAGLILQLDRLWHDHRRAEAKLDHMDAELHVLRQTTTLLGNSPASPGTAFYAHFAEGAAPQLLLSDLKSQLDLLAVRISQLE